MLQLKNSHPVALILYYLVLICVLTLLKDPILLLFCFLVMLLIGMQYLLGSQLVSEMYFIVAITLLTVITTVFFYHNGVTPLFYVNDQAVTFEVIVYAVALSVLFGALWLIIQLIIATLPSSSIIYVFTKILPALGVFMAMCIRFIPELKARYQAVIEAQNAIGYLSSPSFFEVMRLKMKIALESLYWTFEKSMKKAMMMSVRGFSSGKRSSYKKYRFQATDRILVIMACSVAIYYSVTFSTSTYYYFPALKAMTLYREQLPYLLLILLPLGIEWKGWIQWYYYKSKM